MPGIYYTLRECMRTRLDGEKKKPEQMLYDSHLQKAPIIGKFTTRIETARREGKLNV
jgi:hypothetical protein